MKRLIHSPEDIFAMSKVLNKYAIPEVSKVVGKYVYFSESNSSHAPRIKFYGGTKETSSTKDAPTFAFDVDGNCTLELASWMNKKNCPNAFDKEYLSNLESFVKNYKSILLLVWFKHLDEGDALAYFHGQISFRELLNECEFYIPEEVTSVKQLDDYCAASSFYKF